ncbi:MAG: HAD-IIIA family hydrolase [Muribaculaceae bacterium]|nr:HAD-IIIA family hydrolase [Muribaculaceae bacterium]
MLPKLFITDIDGVWTNGGMYYTADGDVMKRFSVKDGWGVAFLRHLEIPLAIFTGENSPVVAQRAKKLGIEKCYLGVKDKLELAKKVCEEMNISLQEVAFIGDDINDLPLLTAVGFSGCPKDSPFYIEGKVNFPGKKRGGDGAFREFVEAILLREGMLLKVVDQCAARH